MPRTEMGPAMCSRILGERIFASAMIALRVPSFKRRIMPSKHRAPTKAHTYLRESFILPAMLLRNLEARVGIEPTHKGFADLSLTTWVPRLGWAYLLLPC